MPKRLVHEEAGDPSQNVNLQARVPRWVKNAAIRASAKRRPPNLTLWLCEAIVIHAASTREERVGEALVSRMRESGATSRVAPVKPSRKSKTRTLT